MSTIEAVLRLEDRSQMAMHAVRLSAREISSGSEFAGEDFHQLAARYLHYHLLTWIEGKYLIAAKQEFGIETSEFAESYYQLMKMDVEGSLQMAEKGDYREVKRILLERSQSAIGHTENESQVAFEGDLKD